MDKMDTAFRVTACLPRFFMSHNHTTKLNRPIIREAALPLPETGRPLMVRLDSTGIVLWEKRSRKRIRLSFSNLVKFAQERTKKAQRLRAKRERLNKRRWWAQYFIKLLELGYKYRQIAAFLLLQGILNDKGKPWSFSAINFCVNEELNRMAKTRERKKAMAARAEEANPKENIQEASQPGLQGMTTTG
jgi:hypothetical protein